MWTRRCDDSTPPILCVYQSFRAYQQLKSLRQGQLFDPCLHVVIVCKEEVSPAPQMWNLIPQRRCCGAQQRSSPVVQSARIKYKACRLSHHHPATKSTENLNTAIIFYHTMGLGVLESKTPGHVPGTALLDQEAAHSEARTSDLKHGLGKDNHIVLVPQPSEDPNDPLNWSFFQKHLVYFIICLGTIVQSAAPVCICPDYLISSLVDIHTRHLFSPPVQFK